MKEFRKFTVEELEGMSLAVLREIGRQMYVKSPTSLRKECLIENIIGIQKGTICPVPPTGVGAPRKSAIDVSEYYLVPNECQEFNAKPCEYKFSDVVEEDTFVAEGVLEKNAHGYGFLRANNYEISNDDIFIGQEFVKEYKLKPGDKVKCYAKAGNDGKSPAFRSAITINDLPPELFLKRKNFDALTPDYPTRRINLITSKTENDLALRCVDLFAPLGFGQRGLIVAPPKTGKTTLLKKIASAIEENHPDVKLIVLLVDERPEEVTDFRRSIKSEVVFSTFDENPTHHVSATELVLKRAKRLVEVGQDVVILMDSITRLTRAYNTTKESSGKILSGGIDPIALMGPKEFFGAARNIVDGGSLTILSTALIDTGSRMDDVIYEEFKGTGNMEVHLSRELSEKRIFPAIDLVKSGTRNDHLLLTKEEQSAVEKLRKILYEKHDATDLLIDMLKKTKSNRDLISKLDGWLKIYNGK